MKYVKRTEIMGFLNTTPTDKTANWGLVGRGMTTGTYTYDASESSDTDIIHDTSSTEVEGYSINLDSEMKCIYGDPIYDFINDLRLKLAVHDEATTQFLGVDKYMTTKSDAFRAQLFDCSISIKSYGGDGGATPTIGFKINLNGDPKNGTVTLTDGKPVFTETNVSATASK